jgi:hypothetical protein
LDLLFCGVLPTSVLLSGYDRVLPRFHVNTLQACTEPIIVNSSSYENFLISMLAVYQNIVGMYIS